MVESRKYKFNLIFDKKFTSILSAAIIGSITFSTINTGVFFVVTTLNKQRIASLEVENNTYLTSLSTLEGQQAEYLKQKANADNIYNISDKPTKWSSIIESIATQLPYDTVLTSVETTTADTINTGDSSGGSTTPDTTPGATTDGTTDGSENGSSTDNTTPETNSEEALDEQISSNENMVNNDTIVITGKSLSMVNLSLFLDKLDTLDIFNKVECSNAEKGDDSDYYDFTIYAYLN